jgi:biopolymer transport protein ExbD
MFDQETQPKPKMNITPLIDIIFLLVIFFMLSTSFIKLEALNMFVDKEEIVEQESTSNLSAAQKAIQKYAAQEAILRVNGNGFQVNGVEISENELAERLKEAVASSSSNKLIIEVGEGVRVQKLVELIDLAQTARAKNVQIERFK